MKNNLNISYHLDNLRKQKNITVETLTDGICTDRQFRRYLTGENDVSSKNITLFCNKLGISLSDFYYSLAQKDRYEYGKLTHIYTFVINKKFEKASELLSQLSNLKYLDNQNKMFLDYLMIRVKYELKKINSLEMYRTIMKTIDYPGLIKSNLFCFVDILYLHLICLHEVKNKNSDTLLILRKILQSGEEIYISSENKTILPPIFANLSNYLGKLDFINESLSLANSGIDFCIKNNLNDSLPHLYYSRMLGLFNTGNVEDSHFAAIECLS